MNRVHVLSAVACLSLLLATGAMAEILGVQPGTSDNPKDNVPKEIQKDGGTISPGSSGPGTRSDELVGMKNEKSEPVTLQELEQNVEKTQGGGAAIAAEDLKKESMVKSDRDISDQSSQKDMKQSTQTGSAAQASVGDSMNDGPKKDPTTFQQQNADTAAQVQDVINRQPLEKP